MNPNAKTRLSEQKPDPFIGRTFDGYRIESILGRGGMGTVYRAQQLSLGRPVAIKVLPSDLAEKEQFLERFLREADALSRLNHPNVVSVYDRGEVDGQPYLAMEYVEGTSLREITNNGPLPASEALRIVSSVLAALDHAHANGIVHRDIKPENVLLSKGNVVKVADFGLSRLLGPEDTTRLTRTQLVLGTYEYMAPEQREFAKEADPRSDLFATGVVLYEMLTGELPIGRFALPSRRRPEDCDSRVDDLIERSLDKNPARRYQSADEMADAVSVILERPEPIAAPRAEPVPPAPRGGFSYRPMRFEYHLDNLATIDHVLGTICYVLGTVALFGLLGRAWEGIGVLCLFFFAGWYLRNTAEGLRRYKSSARTAQAVIAIGGGLVGVLLPFSVYSFWVLFSHRGRTYFDARGRGLTEQAAARHVHRVMEEPFPAAPLPPPPPPPQRPVVQHPPRAPRPSQIPVQSMVTSEVRDVPRCRRRSPFVRWGWRIGWLTVLLAIAAAVVGHRGLVNYFQSDDIPVSVFAVAMFATFGLLTVGLFHALFSRRATGVISAMAAFVVFGIVLGIFGATFPLMPRPRKPVVRTDRILPYTQQFLGSYRSLPRSDFEADVLRALREGDWLADVVGVEEVAELTLVRQGKSLWLRLPADVGRDRKLQTMYAVAVQTYIEHAIPGSFVVQQIYATRPAPFDRRLRNSPPPRPKLPAPAFPEDAPALQGNR